MTHNNLYFLPINPNSTLTFSKSNFLQNLLNLKTSFHPTKLQMTNSMALSHLAIILAINIFMAGPTYAQINTPCNPSTLSTLFTPCMSFLTNSSANGTSPTTQCCTALKSLTSGGMDCLCLIVTASVPFKIPINRTLAISLPRACKMPGVPVQCKGKKSPSIFFFCFKFC